MQAEFDSVLAQQGRLLFSDDEAREIRTMLSAQTGRRRQTVFEKPRRKSAREGCAAEVAQTFRFAVIPQG